MTLHITVNLDLPIAVQAVLLRLLEQKPPEPEQSKELDGVKDKPVVEQSASPRWVDGDGG